MDQRAATQTLEHASELVQPLKQWSGNGGGNGSPPPNVIADATHATKRALYEVAVPAIEQQLGPEQAQQFAEVIEAQLTQFETSQMQRSGTKSRSS